MKSCKPSLYIRLFGDLIKCAVVLLMAMAVLPFFFMVFVLTQKRKVPDLWHRIMERTFRKQKYNRLNKPKDAN